MAKSMLFVLGGIWHDFEGFTSAIAPIFEASGWVVRKTYDLNELLALGRDKVDVVVSYTCLGKHREGYDDHGPERMEDEQVHALSAWVQSGGKLFAVHSATVLAGSNHELGRLMGGVFVEHPPAFSFTVYPFAKAHPITEGVGAFTVHDEFYVQTLVTPVEIHMIALDRGVAYPMVWSKREGAGKVAHVAMGHGPEVWNLEPYQRLMRQGVDWLMA